MIKALSPQEVMVTVEDAVISVFNELLSKRFDGTNALIFSYESYELILKKLKLPKDAYLNLNQTQLVQKAFKESGWNVKSELNYNGSESTRYTFTINA